MKNFLEVKEKYIKQLETCKNILQEAEKFVDLKSIQEKIDRTIKDLKNEKIKIVLFGGFSDGKTTILSMLLNRADLKISPAPTTDKIEEYSYEDYLIIDTPGLFSENIEHDEKTTRYISEADLIIFVTNAMNPLKESQHPTIKWLLKDLGKLNQTIFVINKLDETGIFIEDKEDFKRMCAIKKEVVTNTLNQILEIEKNDYLSVCLIGNPWSLGVDHWLNNRAEYERLSNINELESLVNSIIENNKYKLIEDKANSVIKDVVLKTREDIKSLTESMEMNLKKIAIQKKELEQQLNEIRSELIKATNRIIKRIDSLRRDLISKINSTSDMEELSKVIQEEIGSSKNAEVLEMQIRQVYLEELEPFYNYLMEVQTTLENLANTYEDIDRTLEFVEELEVAKPIVKSMLLSVKASSVKNTILVARKTLNLPIKFKPWGLVKLSKNISLVLNVLGTVLDAIFTVVKIINKVKFDNKRNELVNNLNKLFDEISSLTTPEFLKENFLSVILKYEKSEEQIKKQYEELKNEINKLKQISIILNKCKEV